MNRIKRIVVATVATTIMVNSTILSARPKTACAPPMAGFTVISPQELETPDVEKASYNNNPLHASYGVYPMRWKGKQVAVKIDTDSLNSLLPVYRLEKDLLPYGGVEILGVLDKENVELLLAQHPNMRRNFSDEDKELGFARAAESAVVLIFKENIRQFRTEMVEIATTFPPQPAVKVIQQVAKLFVALEKMRIIPRDFQLFLNPEGQMFILEMMSTAIYFTPDGTAMSRGVPLSASEGLNKIALSKLIETYTQKNISSHLDQLFKGFLEALETINTVADLQGRKRVYYLKGPNDETPLPYDLNFRHLSDVFGH